ncbi:MAG: OmpH family outer membrane protein [Armatimonadia bacterium]
MSRRLLCGLSVLALFAALTSSVASAQELKIAILDMEKVRTGFTEAIQSKNQLGAYVQDKMGYLRSLENYLFVAGAEFQEVAAIAQIPKAQWTADQKKREAEILAIAQANEKKFTELQSKSPRSADENHQYTTLQEMLRDRSRDRDKIAAVYQEELGAKSSEVQAKLMTRLQQVIETMYKEKGYNLVLDKAVTFYVAAPLVVITDDVIKMLNAATPAQGAGDGGATK